MPHFCKECGKEFVKYNSLQKCCSVKCQTKLNKIKDKEKKEKKKEKERVSFPVLVKLLDTLVSKYIRLKYSKDGICECVSCGKKISVKEAHNCHWINRGVRIYRFEEENLIPGCSGCNLFNKEFHLREYTMKQIERLGIDKVNEMREKAREVGKKPSKERLQEKIEYYKEQVKILEDNK